MENTGGNIGEGDLLFLGDQENEKFDFDDLEDYEIFMVSSDEERVQEACDVFLKAIDNYFRLMTDVKVSYGVPYLKDYSDIKLKEYTGMIGISGDSNGLVYTSADKELFEELIKDLLTIDDPAEEDILDMVGEISSVIASNIKAKLDINFMISNPIIFKDNPDQLDWKQKTSIYVVPVYWKNFVIYMILGLE